MKKITLSIIAIIAIITASLLLINQNQAKGKQSKNHPNHNTPPKAKHETFTLDEDTKTYIALKATDEDNDTIGYRVSKQPKHGKLKGKANELLTYIPNKDYNGKDSFSFIANDGSDDSNETAIDINITPVADLKGLKFSIDATEVNRDTNISYTITPIYDKGKIPKELKELKGLEIVSDVDNSIKVDYQNKTLIALKDTNLTLKAKIGNIISNPQMLNVYWEVNGHRLPPEPDPKVNNSTLLGVDVNHNGVRDDVERFIIIEEAKNKEFPKTQTAISLQYAWAWQKMIENPSLEIRKYLEDASNCQEYFINKHTIGMTYHEYIKWEKMHPGKLGIRLEDKIFNTKERILRRFEFNKACSGHIFDLPEEYTVKSCRTNIDKLGE